VGGYSIATALHSSDTHVERNYEWRDLAFTFNVANLDKASFVGMTWLHPEVECLR
jgi:lipopolysaccharide transport system ATP-binding protein